MPTFQMAVECIIDAEAESDCGRERLWYVENARQAWTLWCTLWNRARVSIWI